MPRYRNYSLNNPRMRQAVQCICDGLSFHKAFIKTGITPTTIKKYYLQYKISQSLKKAETSTDEHSAKFDDVDIFTKKQETALIECFEEFESLFYGLSEKECRMLAYQMVVKEDLKIPHGWKHGMARVAWLFSFKKRHPKLYLVKPTRCSMSTGGINIHWEKKNVEKFYDDLERIFVKSSALKCGTRIFSLDETYTSIDPTNKVACRDSKSDLVTTCCIVNASGTSLPPVIVKPHRNLENDVFSETPPGAKALTASRGRITPDLFPDIMQHFVKHSKSSLENPSILIMDIDICHLSSAALDLAKASGVNVLTIHPHVSKQLQPLEKLYDSYHNNYDAIMDSWLDQCAETDEDIAFDLGKIVGEAYLKTMAPERIREAFKKCGILPFDRDLFTDSDYLCNAVSDQSCFVCKSRDDRSRRPVQVADEVCKDKVVGPVVGSTVAPEQTAGSANAGPSRCSKSQAVQCDE